MVEGIEASLDDTRPNSPDILAAEGAFVHAGARSIRDRIPWKKSCAHALLPGTVRISSGGSPSCRISTRRPVVRLMIRAAGLLEGLAGGLKARVHSGVPGAFQAIPPGTA